MFAPPICRRRWRNNAFRSVSSDEDGGNPANIAASGASNQTQRDPQRAAASNQTQRIARRRAEEEGADTLHRLRANEEGSGKEAPASASGASNIQGTNGGVLPSASDDGGGGFLDVRAADLQEELAEQRFSVRQLRRRRRQPSEHRSERSEQ